MSSKAEQITRQRVLGAFRALALVFMILTALLAAITTAEAKDIPTQLIIFTDKKVYTDWTISSGKSVLNTAPTYQAASAKELRVWVFAVVLDDDGNIMKGRSSNIVGSLNFTRRLDHSHNSTKTTHHNSTPLNPATLGWSNFSLVFVDNGGVTGDTSGDGIYTTMVDLIDITDTSGGILADDHILINITAKDNGIAGTSNTKMVNVLLSSLRCHQTTDPTSHTTQHTGVDGTTDLCTVCHAGHEHFFETISKTIPDDQLDVHTGRMNPPPIYSANKGFGGFVWNRSNFATGGNTTAEWESVVPGLRVCAACHFNRVGSTGYLYDYGSGDRSNANDRPSCSAASVSQRTASGGVEQTITCHATTPMQGVPTIDWTLATISSVAGEHAWNYNVYKSKSHNHSTSLTANVSCAVCHGTPAHGLKLPNMSANIARGSGNINDQCILCHNITGGLNITSNGITGGENASIHEGKTNCKSCHMDQTLKLDTHLVPTASIPNANCTECHDLGGISPYHIDLRVFNKSDYVHNQYNLSKGLRPLNFNASNGSALRASENKICWGCHGDDPNNDGKANFSEQPADKHPTRYINSRTCEECHQNASATWHAPQNVAHSNNTNEVRTPGAPKCYDCHGQPVMINSSNKDQDFNISLKSTLANHYEIGFPALKSMRGTDGYCTKYCHQNTSSPFKLEFNDSLDMERPNHSAMTSRPANQTCIDAQCHAAEELHGSEMRKPTFAGGNFGNANCTANGCHSISDPPYVNYSYHNGEINCTSCHMNNIGSNIHPIKYLQNDGTDFAQLIPTAASCKSCHYNGVAYAVMNGWGVTPRTVGAQHHSTDPENGSKWNKTIDPYWNFDPSIITFVTGWMKNSNRGFIANFDAMKDPNSSAATISENTTEDSLAGKYPSNHNFTSSASGWFANGTATTILWSPSDGNPSGSGGLIVTGTDKNPLGVDANWTAAFVYDKTGVVADASIKLDNKLMKASNMNIGLLKAINVTIQDNLGNSTEVFSRLLPDTPEQDWDLVEKTIPNPNTVFWKNGTLDHTYNVTIRTRWTGLGGKVTPDIKVAYDNIFVNVTEVDYKKYNFTFYINNTPPSDNYTLIVGYQTQVEPARLYVKNGSSFKYRADLDSGAFTKAIIPLSKEEYGDGNVTLRINDSNGPGESPSDVNEIDVKPDYLEIEYMFIDSYKWINNSRVNYPCEYCHASNKHFQHALGIPYSFKGNNSVGQNLNSSTTWCASCHYQGYSSGSKNYTDMIKSFLDQMFPVPPEITGHSLFGVNKSQSPDYYEHSELSSFDDSTCWNCHRGKMADGSTSTQFLHNVSEGTSGGMNCTACHGPSGSATGMLVNFTSVGKGMHASLNKNASSTAQNATNKPCWGCHGTHNGTWANETDQPVNDHDQTYKQSARKCHDCHSDTLPLFGAKTVTDHIPSGLSIDTDVSTSKYNNKYCAYCHNNSIGVSFDPDDLGSDPMNASAAHYGSNSTMGMLMSPANNSTDCNFCHTNTSNMPKWGILPESRANISNKNGTSGTGTNHTQYYMNNQCYSCHGGTVNNFHVSAMSPGEKGNPDCAACHNISSPGTYLKVDFVAINASAHGNLNKLASASDGNISNKACWGCHGTQNGTYANESDQPSSDHNNTFKSTPRKCEDCHINSSIQFNAPGLTEHIMSGRNALTQINVTEGYCSVCHNNSITANSDSDGIGISSAINASVAHYARDANVNLMTTATHSDNCTYCHFINNGSNLWLTPRKPLTSTHSSLSNDTQPSICWGCHVDSPGEPSTFHIQAINKGSGSGPDCRSCHNISDTDPNRGHIDISVFNTSIHANMNTTGGTNANEPCWGCHGNGNSEGHNISGDTSGKGSYRNPYNCTDCHISVGIRYAWASARNALTAAEHFSGGADIRASYDAKTIFSCLRCHQDIGEMRLSSSDTDTNRTVWNSGGDTYNVTIGGNNSPYHYGKKRPDLRSGINTSCIYCHRNFSTPFPLSQTNRSIREHTEIGAGNTTGGSCTSSKCHSAGLIHDINLSKNITLNWTPGGKDYCAPCHKPGNSSATKYVHNQKHDPANTSSDRIGDCGFCHNASSQGINGGTLRIHTSTLTNTTSSVLYGTCEGCHNGTALYVGAAKQIFSHLPNGSQYRGNTSMSNYTCEKCHNMTIGSSMHSAGMDRSNGTCVTCHFNRISQFNATVKKIESWDYNHTYAGQKTCSITQCHNASGVALGFHLDRFAGAVVADPERVNGIWGDRNNAGNGFTDTLYVDCIDCHREHNNTHPFNNTYPFNYSRNDSFYYEANRTGENKKIHSTSDSMDSCYNCHTDKPDIKNPQNRYKVHNVSIEPLLGGPACVSCHNKSAPTTTGYPPITKKVNLTAFDQSVHSRLVNFTLWNDSKKQNSVLLDSACWTCHSTNLTGLPNNAHPDRGGPASLRPFQCDECHTPEGNMSMFDQEIFQRTPKIYQHYAGKSFIGDKIFNSTKGCYECHENSLVPAINVSYGEYARSGEANGSHYAIRGGLIKTNLTQLGCKQCHAVKDSGGGSEGGNYGNAISVPFGHNIMGSTDVVCQNSCHNSDPAISITNHNINLGIYLGESSCYSTGCHTPPTCEECTR